MCTRALCPGVCAACLNWGTLALGQPPAPELLYSLLFSCFHDSEYEDENGPKHWIDLRYEHVMKLRQAALDTARQMWADYFLVCHLSSRSEKPLRQWESVETCEQISTESGQGDAKDAILSLG